MTFYLGLTGGIATGKSTAASYFRERGLRVIDADQIAHAQLADVRLRIARLQALETNATNAANEIPAVAADTTEPALATVAATPPAATPAARP